MRCVRCGCTTERACPGGCHWVSTRPPKCSACFDENGEPLLALPADAVGAEEDGLFGIEYCPASDVPAPHAPLFLNEVTCYCARCKTELAA